MHPRLSLQDVLEGSKDDIEAEELEEADGAGDAVGNNSEVTMEMTANYSTIMEMSEAGTAELDLTGASEGGVDAGTESAAADGAEPYVAAAVRA